jgi:hypothetical protein
MRSERCGLSLRGRWKGMINRWRRIAARTQAQFPSVLPLHTPALRAIKGLPRFEIPCAACGGDIQIALGDIVYLSPYLAESVFICFGSAKVLPCNYFGSLEGYRVRPPGSYQCSYPSTSSRNRYITKASTYPNSACRNTFGSVPTMENPSFFHRCTAASFVATTRLNCMAR